MTEPTLEVTEDDLTPTENLILEVVATRERCGDWEWPIRQRHKRQIEHLTHLGLVAWRFGPVEKHLGVALTDAGRKMMFNPSYLEEDTLFSPWPIPELRRRIAAAMERRSKRWPADIRACVSTPTIDELQRLVDIGDEPVLRRFLDDLAEWGIFLARDGVDGEVVRDPRSIDLVICQFFGIDLKQVERERGYAARALEQYPDPAGRPPAGNGGPAHGHPPAAGAAPADPLMAAKASAEPVDLDEVDTFQVSVPKGPWEAWENHNAEFAVSQKGPRASGSSPSPTYGLPDYGQAVAHYIAAAPRLIAALAAEVRMYRARHAEALALATHMTGQGGDGDPRSDAESVCGGARDLDRTGQRGRRGDHHN